MPIPLPHYVKVKDNYCIAYFGPDDSVLEELKQARQMIEKALPGLKLYIACKDESAKLLVDEPNIVLQSEIPCRQSDFMRIRELDISVNELLEESNIKK